MINKVEKLIKEDTKYKKLILSVYEQPYISNKDLLSKVDQKDRKIYEEYLDNLVNDFIFVELTSQAGSSIESRIPQKIFIINPEIEEDIEDIL